LSGFFVVETSVSIADLKAQLRDVPGFQGLTMQSIGGRQVFGCNGLIAAVDPTANAQEIESAIRDASAMRQPAIATTTAAPTSLPPNNLTMTEAKPMTPPPAPSSPIGIKPGELSGLFKQLRARKEAMIADIQANGAEVAAVLAAGEQMSAGLKADADALKAEFGQLTNFPTAE